MTQATLPTNAAAFSKNTVRRRQFLATSAVVACTLAAPNALAESTRERLRRTRKVERYRKSTRHSKTQAGCARAAVQSDISSLEKVVTDYRRYRSFIPKFKKARVVGRKGDTTQVYLEVPVLKGAAKVWALMSFGPPKQEGNKRVVRGHMLKGNVDRLDVTWVLSRIDGKNTQLDLHLLILPRFPAPRSLISKEAARAADEAVTGSRRRAERG